MSPEQANSGELDTDTRADVYSLGAILYELLVGVPPLGLDLREHGIEETRRAILYVQPERPSATLSSDAKDIATVRGRDVSGLIRETRGDLDWIVMKCLEKDRARRYDSAAELAGDLQRFLADEPVLAGPPTLRYRLRKALRKHHRAFGVAAASFAVMFLAAVWALFEKRQAEENATEARAALRRAEAMSDFLSDTLSGASPYRARGADASVLVRIVDDAADRIERGELAGDPESEVELRILIAGLYGQLTEWEKRRRMLEPTERMAREVGGDESVLLAKVLARRASSLARVSNSLAALELYDQSIEMRRRLDAIDSDFVTTLVRRVSCLRSMGRTEAALKAADEAIGTALRLERHDRPLLRAQLAKASVLRRLNRPYDALEISKEAVELARDAFPRDAHELIRARNSLADGYFDVGRFAEALGEFEANLAHSRRIHKGPHPDTAWALRCVSSCHAALRDKERALEFAEEALAMHREIYPEGHGQIADTLLGVSRRYRALGRHDDALAACDEAVAIRRRIHDRDHPELAATLFVHGVCLRNAERFESAVTRFEEAVAIWRRSFDGDRVEVARALLQLADTHSALDRYDRALRHYDEAAAAYYRAHDRIHVDNVWVEKRRGDCLSRLHRHEDAFAAYDQAESLARKMTPVVPWTVARIEMARAALLVDLERFGEAEQRLLSIEKASMEAVPSPALRTDYAEARAALYQSWDQPDRAAQWRARAVEADGR